MVDALYQLALFSAKALILVLLILFLLAGIIALLSRGKEKTTGKIKIKNLNEKFLQTTEDINQKILSKKKLKDFLKEQKAAKKTQKEAEDTHPKSNVFVINFHGDIKASAVASLREEVTAILGVAKSGDKVVVCVESAGGMAHAYGLAAAQLERIKQCKIPLIVCVDKIAASGGYMMASVADKILAAPFAIIGSIGVIVQIPNFHRLLKEKNIDFEQLTAGNYKRTLTIFGQNTDEGRAKLREEIEEIHQLFKDMIKDNRKQIDIEQVATGEHWPAKQALEYKLVDELKTSDDFLVEQSKLANVFEVCFMARKSFAEKLFATANAVRNEFQLYLSS